MGIQLGFADRITYVFDSGPLIDIFRHYYPGRFPTFWTSLEDLVALGDITSTREVRRELIGRGDAVSTWVRSNQEVFPVPTATELEFVREIFKIKHFQNVIRAQERLLGRPVADPFVIARAASVPKGCVVTTEVMRPNAARIPNICQHFEVHCTDLKGFMELEDWSF